jgi:type IV fimbrial biogenesis protein FimT/type IV fimbrial biogenesis protein FimU
MLYQRKSQPLKGLINGFTLVELIVTIAVVTVISAVALPSMNEFLVQMRVDNQVSEMQRLLLTARNVAINTGKNTTICPLSNTDACADSTNWVGAVGVINEDGVVKQKSAVNSGDKVVFAHKSIVYTPTGRTASDTSGTISFCPKDYAKYNRGIDVAVSGRVYSTSDTDADGKDENRSGTEISCT